MNRMGEVVKVNAVRFFRILPGPVERVWSFLTESDKLTVWYGEDGTIEPRMGGLVRIMNGHIRGVVTQWEPPKKLIYTWNVFDPGEDVSRYPESFLKLELEAKGSEVALELFHLPIMDRVTPQTKMGWHTYLDLMEASLGGETVTSRESYMKANAKRYGVDLNNLAT